VGLVDRREALKKLAAGSAVAFASPLILKSTAFADGGTVSCQPSPFDDPIGVIGGNMGITAQPGAPGAPGWVQLLVPNTTDAYRSITCPASTRVDQFRWNVTSQPGTNTTVVLNGGGANDITDSWTVQNRVRIATSGRGSSLLDAGPYTVQVTFRVVCTSSERTCWRCATFTATFIWDPVTSTVSAGSSSGAVGAANCDTPEP